MTRPEDIPDAQLVQYVVSLLEPPSARSEEEAIADTAYMYGLLYEDVAGPWMAHERNKESENV
jgi:hypothetical protein